MIQASAGHPNGHLVSYLQRAQIEVVEVVYFEFWPKSSSFRRHGKPASSYSVSGPNRISTSLNRPSRSDCAVVLASSMATAAFRTRVQIFDSPATLQGRLIAEKLWAEVDWEWVDRHYSPEVADRLYNKAMKDDKLKF